MIKDVLLMEYDEIQGKIEALKSRKLDEISQDETDWIDQQLQVLQYYQAIFSGAIEAAA
jgi:hypothetical protein